MKAKFNQVDEFITEMEKDKEIIDRKIVRVTMLYRSSSISPNIHNVFVLATYSIGNQIVQLEKFYGELWHINKEKDQETIDKARFDIEAIDKKAEDFGLETRSGALEE